MAFPSVDVLVVPREQFGKTAQSLESLFSNTHVPFSLVYVDGNSPRNVRRYLEHEAKRRAFTLVRTERYLSANVARNIGLRHCKADYVAFLDNDVAVLPGWLERLVTCAEETGAGIVGPLYYLGDPLKRQIHTAGAELAIQGDGAGKHMHERHHWVNADARSVRLSRGAIDLVEFHCLLARREVLKAVPLDEQLLSFLDHNDFCLQAKAAGFSIYSEPSAVVSHLSPPPLALSDIPYFFLRWSNAWIDPSIKHFAQKHGLALTDDALQGHYRYRDAHRLRLIGSVRKFIAKTLGLRACNAMDRAIDTVLFDGVLERAVRRRAAAIEA